MASMNAGIILSGQQPDFLNIIDRANTAAQSQINNENQNALTSTIRREGPGALAGNPQSLNALARFDPAAAQGLQAGQQSMRINEEQLKLSYENARVKGLEYAAGVSEQEAKAKAAMINKGLAMGSRAENPQQWDQIMQGLAPEYVGKFGEREIIFAGAMGLVDALEAAKPPAASDRYKVVGTQVMDLLAEGGPRAVATAPGQQETIYDPTTGNPIIQRGSATKFTEGQSKDNVYATRARGAMDKFEPVADALTSRAESLAEGVPLGIGREFQSDDYQVAKNAGNEFLQAILRKDTGAAITEQEQDLYGKTYLPQPGDGEAVLQAKREARARALSAIEAGMTVQQINATERALIDAARTVGGAATQPRPGPAVIDGFTIEAIE